MIDKEDRVLFEKKFLKTFLRQFGFAESIHNKMPPRKDSRSGLRKRFETISTEEVNAHASFLFNHHKVGCLDFFQMLQEVKSFSPLTPLRFKVSREAFPAGRP